MSISILVYILSAVVVLILFWIIVLQYRLRKIFMGQNGKNLEELMVNINRQTLELRETQKAINKHLEQVDTRLSKSIRNVETIRFNPFEDAGSNQSFALSFLNDEGNGVVISSLYARDRMSIFAKPIENGKSSYELSKEEKEVLDKSK